MKALVTGGSGYLGKNLIKELLCRNIETISYDVLPPSSDVVLDNKQFSHVDGDILDFDSLGSAMEGCDYVFHTAALANLDETRTMPTETMEVNVVGTAKCLQAAHEAGVKRFMLASTVYASGNHGSFYRISKQAGESLCKSYFDEFGLAYTIVRYGSLYGNEANHWNFVYNVCKELLTKGEFTYLSSPDAIREYIHIQDASRETVNIVLDDNFVNRCAMISGHQRMAIIDLFEMITEIINRDVIIHYTPKETQSHYVKTPYTLETDVPVRINHPYYIDISEGILGCLQEVQKEIDSQK